MIQEGEFSFTTPTLGSPVEVNVSDVFLTESRERTLGHTSTVSKTHEGEVGGEDVEDCSVLNPDVTTGLLSLDERSVALDVVGDPLVVVGVDLEVGRGDAASDHIRRSGNVVVVPTTVDDFIELINWGESPVSQGRRSGDTDVSVRNSFTRNKVDVTESVRNVGDGGVGSSGDDI